MKFALRSLLKSPGFTTATVLTLALGIGATTAIFSVLYAVLLKPFPYPDADRLVVMWQKGPQMEMSISWPTGQDWMRDQQAFTALSIYRRDRFNIADPGQLPENIGGAYASASLFDVAALGPKLGRFYTASDDQPNAAPVVVISETLWSRRYARDPALLGRTIPVDGIQRTVIGIAPADFALPTRAELWVPIVPHAATQKHWDSRGNNPGLYCFARLKPGISLDQARADMERLYVGLREAHPDFLTGVSAVAESFHDNQLESFRAGLWSLLAATAFVLAIACANVAGLFITRGVQQQRDYAVRSALGASRAQLIRGMLGESLLIATLGGLLGIVLAWSSLGLIRHFVPADVPRFQNIELNAWVLVFSFIAAALSGIVAGLWPALKLARVDVRNALHEGGRGSTAGSGVRRILVGAQVALTLVLLSACGLIIRSLDRMQNAPLGFDGSSVLTLAVSLPQARYAEENEGSTPREFLLRLLERVSKLPGVIHASTSTTPPLNSGWQSIFRVEGVHDPDERNAPLAEMAIVSDDFFNTLKIPVLQGRSFDARDATGPRVTIIDEAFAKKYWPGENPIGKRVRWDRNPDDAKNLFTVIGVVPTVRVDGYSEPVVRPQAYWSLRQSAWHFNYVLIRTAQHPRTLEKSLRELFGTLDPEIAFFDLTTMDEQIAETYENTTLQSFLLSLFAALAFFLAIIGLYSVVAYGVSMRRREIGVRVALGAQNHNVIALMLRQGLVPLAVGSVVGLLGALAAGRALRSQLYEISPTDPTILAAATILLAVAATLACWLPARKAAGVDPMIALRSE